MSLINVSFTLDRLGRQRTITDGTGTRTFSYNDALQLAAETNAFGTITRHYDSFGRSSGLAVGANYQVGYGYSGDGRFASVTSSVQSVSSVVNYSYLPNSDLISGWSNGILSTVKNYEAHRDLISAVENQSGASLISRFGYVNDAIGMRTQRIDSGSATATNAFGYNPRSELTSAAMGTNAYGYAYDAIGNRTAVSNNAEDLTYSANALNQYTNILRVSAPPREDLPRFDLDGNLTNYNGWSYAWDGENRLIGAVNGSTVVSNQYDYMSRRVQKVVNGVTNRFVYDGWNLASETTSIGVTNVFVWGMDLSGSLQGAGGIGGLMAVVRNGHAYHPMADANGNITDYVDTNGTIVAHYEFDAFGNTVAQSGTLAFAFTYRFSTKYLDAETGLYYYGYRYYSPGLGRWVNRDPIEEKGGQNLYVFILNFALNDIDAHGLIARWYRRQKCRNCPDRENSPYLAQGTDFEVAGYLRRVIIIGGTRRGIPGGGRGGRRGLPGGGSDDFFDGDFALPPVWRWLPWSNVENQEEVLRSLARGGRYQCRKSVGCAVDCSCSCKETLCHSWTIKWDWEKLTGRLAWDELAGRPYCHVFRTNLRTKSEQCYPQAPAKCAL